MNDNSQISFPNTRKSNIPNFSIAQLNSLIPILYNQALYARNCFLIGNRLSSDLSAKYNKLTNKWYVFALNSLYDNMFCLIMKLWNDQNNELSLFNLLNYLSIQTNFSKFFKTTNKQNSFKRLIGEYNLLHSRARQHLIKRRNNWQIHITKIIFNQKKFDELTTLIQSEYQGLLNFSLEALRELYTLLTEKSLHGKTFSTFQEIDEFVNSLNENGDLI